MPQIWYHGTTQENWTKIQERGSLGGEGAIWLAESPIEASCYGPVVLKVRYRPREGQDNYVKGCWQMRVYVPINIRNIHEIKKPIRPTTEMVSRAITDFTSVKTMSRQGAAVITWMTKEFGL